MTRDPELLPGLLHFGRTDFGQRWPDYVGRLGLGPEHVPELIEIASDPDLYSDDLEGEEFWATIHARRALGQIGDARAARPLLDAMDRYIDYDDFWTEELSTILAKMGTAAIPDLVAKLGDEQADEFTRVICGTALEKIAQEHPEARDECVEHLVHQLAKLDPRVPSLNGALVSDLIALKATESIDVIERAYGADVVEMMTVGSLDWVCHDLGLGPKPAGGRYDGTILGELAAALSSYSRRGRPDLAKLKQKRKQQKAARKRNRKHR